MTECLGTGTLDTLGALKQGAPVIYRRSQLPQTFDLQLNEGKNSYFGRLIFQRKA